MLALTRVWLGRLDRLRRGRLGSGVLVQFVALGTQVLVQLLSVPVLTAAYGVDSFGMWLLLFTIPTYFGMSDLGLVTAATNEMSIRWSRGDVLGVQTVFQSLWLGMLTISLAVTGATVLLVLVAAQAPDLWPAELYTHRATIPILTAYACCLQNSYVLATGMRGTGHFARGTVFAETPIFLESVAMLVVATVTRDMTAAASAMLAMRIVALPIIYLGLRWTTPQIRVGHRHASWGVLRKLLPSAVGILGIPVSAAMSVQGTALVIGATLGPSAVAVFASVRTASRFAIQVATMVVRAIIPEMAAAHGRDDIAAEQRYWRLFERARWMVLLPAVIVFALFGSWIVDVWSLGRLQAPGFLVAILALALLPHGSWYLDFYMLTATHSHRPLARPLIMWSFAGLGLTVIGIAAAGLIGAALSVLVIDLILAWRVRHSLKLLLRHDEQTAGAG